MLGIDRRGVVTVLKHRTLPVRTLTAEVTLSYTPEPVVETFSTKAADTLNLASDAEVAAVLTRRTATSATEIRGLLEAACEADRQVLITGIKADGARYHSRRIQPITVGNTLMVCRDTALDAVRTFRLNGIEQAQDA